MSTTANLRPATATVVLDGSGNGTAKIGPLNAREVWSPANVHVSANIGSVTNEAACIVYLGPSATAPYFRDGTLSGSSGDVTDACNADVVNVGDFIWASWVGGDAGVTATLTVTGSKSV
jgi:hypothetical protein